MDKKTRQQIERYVSANIGSFHQRRISNLHKLKLKNVLKSKNPYLFRAKNLNEPENLIKAILEARQSSSEETSFGNFLEDLAIFVATKTGGANKSSAPGIDIELKRNRITYTISVKSGPNWGNQSQISRLEQDFARAVKVLKQSAHTGSVQPTLGICYGRFRTVNNGKYLKIGGQAFWELISGDSDMYKDLITPLAHNAIHYDELFDEEMDKTMARLLSEFREAFCDPSGHVDWDRIIEFNSGNLA